MLGIPPSEGGQFPLDVDVPNDCELSNATLWMFIEVCLLVYILGYLYGRAQLPLPVKERYPSLFRYPSHQCPSLFTYALESSSPPIPFALERKKQLDQELEGIPIFSYGILRPYLGASLGNGAFGSVIALSGDLTGYCLKTFKFGGFRREECIEETRIMQRLAHLKIPKLKGVCLDPPGIVMSCHQMTMLHWILRERPTPMEALDALIQLCHILKDLHQEGFCHNDLKASNVMIDQDANGIHVILIDFGLASPIGTRTVNCGRSLNASEVAAQLESANYRSFYAPKLYVGRECSPSTDAFALAYLTRWILSRVAIRGQGLKTLLQKYSKSFGEDCSVDALLKEMEKIWNAHK